MPSYYIYRECGDDDDEVEVIVISVLNGAGQGSSPLGLDGL